MIPKPLTTTYCTRCMEAFAFCSRLPQQAEGLHWPSHGMLRTELPLTCCHSCTHLDLTHCTGFYMLS